MDLDTLTAELAASKAECNMLRGMCSRQREEIENLSGMADAVERLRDIGRATGCDHVDDPDGRRCLVNCVETTISELEERIGKLDYEAKWVRRKLDLPDDTEFISGQGKTLAGAMHVVCADAFGMLTYIRANKCDDKQGEIARLTVDLANAIRERDEAKAIASRLCHHAHLTPDVIALAASEVIEMRL